MIEEMTRQRQGNFEVVRKLGRGWDGSRIRAAAISRLPRPCLSGCVAVGAFGLCSAVNSSQAIQAFGTSKQADSGPQKVGKLTLDIFDHLGLEGNAVLREQRVELGRGYDHFATLAGNLRYLK